MKYTYRHLPYGDIMEIEEVLEILEEFLKEQIFISLGYKIALSIRTIFFRTGSKNTCLKGKIMFKFEPKRLIYIVYL
jgi:hypothetical protein